MYGTRPEDEPPGLRRTRAPGKAVLFPRMPSPRDVEAANAPRLPTLETDPPDGSRLRGLCSEAKRCIQKVLKK
jgi:hypothetical protein